MRSCAALITVIALALNSTSALAGRPANPAICLPDVSSQRVLSLKLPSGAQRRIDEFRLALGPQAAARALMASLDRVASPGRLMRRQAGQWQTISFWLQERFCLIQFRPAGDADTYGLLTLTDYSTIEPGGANDTGQPAARAELEPPTWWPALQAGKVERWLDAGRRVTTITGVSSSGLPAVRDQIVRAATRAGFLPSAQMLVPSSALRGNGYARAGLMILFQSPDRELAVTLTAVSQVTSVVAHLEEH